MVFLHLVGVIEPYLGFTFEIATAILLLSACLSSLKKIYSAS